jgi:hypothetical protein
VRGFIFFIHPQISLGRSNLRECGGRGMWQERRTYKVLVGKSMQRVKSEVRGIDVKMGSKWILGRWAGGC